MKQFLILAKLAVAGGLLWFVLHNVGIEKVTIRMSGADKLLIVLGIAQLSIQPLLGAWRWRIALSALANPLPFGQLCRITYIGTFFGQILPATVGGDGIRIWLAYRDGCSVKNAVSSVAIERLIMLLTLILMVTITAPWLASLLQFGQLAVLAPVLLMVGVISLILFIAICGRDPGAFRWQMLRGMGHLAAATRQIFFNIPATLSLVGLSIVSYLNIILTVFIFAWAVGQAVSYVWFLVLIPPVLLASTLPISTGGWGTRELAMVLVLRAVNIDGDAALLVSALLGLASVVISLPGAVYYVLRWSSGRERPPLTGSTVSDAPGGAGGRA